MNTRLQVEHPVTELDHRRRSGALADPGRRGRAAAAAPRSRSSGAGRRHRVPGLRRGPGEVPALARHHHQPARALRAGRARRLGRGRRQRDLGLLRSDDLQAVRLGRRSPGGHRSHAAGARTSTMWAASAPTCAFHRRVMRHPAFLAGDYDTGFIERHKAELDPGGAGCEGRRPCCPGRRRRRRRPHQPRATGGRRPVATARSISAWRREYLRR